MALLLLYNQAVVSDMKQDEQQKVGAIIVAAGRGERMVLIDNMFALLGGEPVLARVVSVFEACSLIR